MSNRYGWLVLSVTSLGVLLTMLNIGTLNVALPVVAKHFHADATTSNWILLSYMLFNTIFILMFGRLADLFGRRRLYMIGLSLFTVVSLLIGFAPNIWVFLVLRVIQAAGGAMIITNTTPLISEAFSKEKLSQGLGINVLVASAAQLIGPVVGGFFATKFGWAWVFWFNVPFGIIGVIWAALTLRRMATGGTNERIDWAGNILVFFALSGCIFSLSEASTLGWSNPYVLLGIIIFVVVTPIFIWLQFRLESPLINVRLFRQRRYSAAYAAAFLNSFARTAVVLLLALYAQTVNHTNPFIAGLTVLPVTIGMVVFSPIAGALASRYDAKIIASLGMAVSGLGVLLLIFIIGSDLQYIAEAVSMFFVGAGSALFMTPNTSSIMTTVDPRLRGSANGLRSMLQNMGQVVSTAVSLMLVTSMLPRRLQSSVYAGNSTFFPKVDVLRMIGGFRLALIALFISTVFGVIASLARGSEKRTEP